MVERLRLKDFFGLTILFDATYTSQINTTFALSDQILTTAFQLLIYRLLYTFKMSKSYLT